MREVKSRIILIGGSGFLGCGFKAAYTGSKEVVILSRSRISITGTISENIVVDLKSAIQLESQLRPDDEVIYMAHDFDLALGESANSQSNSELLASSLQACRKAKIKRFIFISSGGAIYGNANSAQRLSENCLRNPISHYGKIKKSQEQYCQQYCNQYHIPLTIIRPSNPYGPNCSLNGRQSFINYAVEQVISRQPIDLFAKPDYLRDYIHIDDFTSALSLILDNAIDQGEVFNIGSSVGRTVFEVIDAICGIVSIDPKSIQIHKFDPAPNQVKYNILDCSKLRSLGWVPRISISTGLTKLIYDSNSDFRVT
jgi:UDP-glucose 4-epimerase